GEERFVVLEEGRIRDERMRHRGEVERRLLSEPEGVGATYELVGADVEAHVRKGGVARDPEDVEEPPAAGLTTEVAQRTIGVERRELLLCRIDGIVVRDLAGRESGGRGDDL